MTDSIASAPQWDEHKAASRVAGRRVIITGAASGIGRRTAEILALEGARVGLLDRDEQGLGATAKLVGEAGAWATADVTDEGSVNAAVAKLGEALGGVDGLVNCAGITVKGGIDEVPIDTWKNVVAVNLIGPYVVAKASLPWLRKSPFATIVNVASGQGLLPGWPTASSYAASKGGLINLTRSMAQELAPLIRVNSVCPGMVVTPMTEGRSGTGQQYALKRNATVTEVAQAILYLTSTESAFVTGVALPVDGGRTFH